MAVSREEIKEYYSNVSMKEHGEMATNTCACGPECIPNYIQKILEEIPEDVISRFYGCGSPLPRRSRAARSWTSAAVPAATCTWPPSWSGPRARSSAST